MIVVHHLNNSRSQRILWLLEELELPYEIKRYQRQTSMLAPPELKKVHPLGKAPVITDGDRVVAESGAILEYLVGRYDRNRLLTPLDEEEALECRYWLHYAEGSLMPLVVMRLIFSRMGKPPVPWLLRPIGAAFGNGVRKGFLDKQLTTHRQFIEQHLTRLPWFAGQHLTLADIQMTFPIQGLAARGGLDGMPATQAWLDKISRRPAWQRAIQQGGELNLPD
ncbi:MAG: glutathione S-transferase [Mixta calida]|uniref:glutathione S-transferase family protein n=1 Tax=Mixta TaxID=2100764 RepID=UPI000535A2B2|nr:MULTISPECIES: glutathione S-transferase [Mixta]AIX72333.1 glutathione S-transferase [Pantoea sp. PSNIH2]MDU3818236.1 glutathione S-transferase [Pantoea sp.]POU44151.1 glutathione S-transferase [Pantoea sp. PSNIH5]POU64893.1 glutathione S-transferase [Pantoea sp. PSNIH4]POY66690.1 glutathione S-transferase [Pantoea sp. PSNIH3]HCW47209.1 glutathione S-transferase [Erwiniaceae bacterium]